MLVNTWEAFCALVFTCGGFSNLFISGGCCVSVCMCKVASVHAACLRVDGIKAAVPYFPCGFILSVRGHGFLMVFHLNTVGLVPITTPVTSLFFSLLLSSALSRHTWGLQAQTASARCVPNTSRDTHARMHTGPECVWVACAQMQRFTRRRFLSYVCISYCFLPFIEYLNKQNILELSCRCTLYFLSSSLKDCDHICDIALLSLSQISVSASDTQCWWRLCRCMWVFFVENVKILFVFHFYVVAVAVLRYSYQGKAAGACIAKYQSACLFVCHFAHLCICLIVQHACQTVCLSIFSPLCYSPGWLLPHVSEAITPFLRLMLFISLLAWICLMARVCVCVLTCFCARPFICGLRMCVTACLRVNLCAHMRLRHAHLSVKCLSVGY